MSAARTPVQPWARPPLARDRPVRTAGGLFRTAQGTSAGINTGLGGVPLIATEDAVVAAVRLAYKVADAQIDRSARLAQRLREAGDRAVGARSDRKAIDATEQQPVVSSPDPVDADRAVPVATGGSRRS